MSRPNFNIPASPVYDPEIPTILDGDPVSANDVLNPLIQRLIDNTHAHQKRLNTAEAVNHTNVWHGRSTTLGATQDKIVTLDEGQPPFVRRLGTLVVAHFSLANTSGIVRVDVAGTGAASIRNGGLLVGGTNLWKNGQRVLLAWGGQAWEIINPMVHGHMIASGAVTRNLLDQEILTAIDDGGNNVWIGSSTSAGSTIAKVITLHEGQPVFERRPGAVILIHFSHANTTAAPTMNIESSGVANIRYRGENIGGPNLWLPNNRVLFFWDGEGWEIINPMIHTDMIADSTITRGKLSGDILTSIDEGGNNVWYATSTTAAATAAKVISLASGQASFKRTVGTILIVHFSNNNSAATPTMNVAGSGDANIRHAGSNIGGANLWQANQRVTFAWDGAGWEIINPMIRTDMIQNNVILNGHPTVPAHTSHTTRSIRNTILSANIPSGQQNGDIWLQFL